MRFNIQKTLMWLAVASLVVLSACSPKAVLVEPLPTHDSVDLGLSVIWARYNVGANKPEEVGGYYAWEKKDVVKDLWDNGWRIPTKEEMQELIDKCEWEWVEQNGAVGQKIKGPSGESIFLPFGGVADKKWGAIFTDKGYYWSSDDIDDEMAVGLEFDLSEKVMKSIERREQMTIRAVKPRKVPKKQCGYKKN